MKQNKLIELTQLGITATAEVEQDSVLVRFIGNEKFPNTLVRGRSYIVKIDGLTKYMTLVRNPIGEWHFKID